MITEDYVSFEVAKLLKEKGFDEECIGAYSETNHTIIKFEPNVKNSEVGTLMYSVPTLQMAMKWFRKVYNIMISPYAMSLGWYFDIFDLTKRDITGCNPLYKVGIPNKEDVLSTYEEAVEAAIKYYIKNMLH